MKCLGALFTVVAVSYCKCELSSLSAICILDCTWKWTMDLFIFLEPKEGS